MEEMGAVNRSVPLETLEEETQKWARALADVSPESLAVTKEFINGVLDLSGYGVSWRSHFEMHTAIQWVRFRKDEVSFYRAKKNGGLKGYLDQRKTHSTPKQKVGQVA